MHPPQATKNTSAQRAIAGKKKADIAATKKTKIGLVTNSRMAGTGKSHGRAKTDDIAKGRVLLLLSPGDTGIGPHSAATM